MNFTLRQVPVFVMLIQLAFLTSPVQGAGLPDQDQRYGPPRTLNTLRTFPEITSRSAWESRARDIRQRAQISCGLWPMPAKTPLHAEIFGAVDRDGYRVEKVILETRPGLFLAGNLYRPLGRGAGPFPAVLNPHGHWSEGRFVDQELGSLAARCIQFARMGMVAFSYDMVGYGDTLHAGGHREFATHPRYALWHVSLMGLQTWNSIRALDFLESLKDVDPKRLACTGGSGGGTQTFMLGAIDDRLAALAPMVMVSHGMQGGCLCENAPGLRVLYSNMEIAAAAAPKPQLLVGASGDWTKKTMTVEGPAIAGVYRLLGQEDRFHYTLFDAPHNYNRNTREEAYRWFARWLLDEKHPETIREQTYKKEPDEALKVWHGRRIPEKAMNGDQVAHAMMDDVQRRLTALKPVDRAGLKVWKSTLEPIWRHSLQLELTPGSLVIEPGPSRDTETHRFLSFDLGWKGRGERIPALMITPKRDRLRAMMILAHPEGRAGFLDEHGEPEGLARRLTEQGHTVILFDAFQTGSVANEKAAEARDPFKNYFHTYNRTDLQERVQDLLTVCHFAQAHGKGRKLVLYGQGPAAAWALLGASLAEATIIDLDGLDFTDEAVLLGKEFFSPGLLSMGGLEGGASLACPRPLLVHGAGPDFGRAWLEPAYQAAGQRSSLQLESSRLEEAAIAEWVTHLK